MKFFFQLSAVVSTFLLSITSCVQSNQDSETCLQRAKLTMQAIYANYSADENCLLRENFPYDHTYTAGYLASEEQAVQGNKYSYLWPFSGTLSAVAAIMESDMSWRDTLDTKVLTGLHQYLDTQRKPDAYASYVNTSAPSDRFYDDNIWLGIDFTDLYLLTGDENYLQKAEMIWKFIESGTDDVLGGGIYWCEQKKASKNTCSNAPGSVYAMKLYKATGNDAYLVKAEELYSWTKKNLLDTTDCLYFDNISLNGDVATWKFAYNSGQMIQSAVLLYKQTSDSSYLEEAKATAAACYDYFFEDYNKVDGSTVRVLKNGNIWFSAVMLRGLIELYNVDGNITYVNAVKESLDIAWQQGRSQEGLFGDDLKIVEKDKKKWLLTQGAMAEMYARLATIKW